MCLGAFTPLPARLAPHGLGVLVVARQIFSCQRSLCCVQQSEVSSSTGFSFLTSDSPHRRRCPRPTVYTVVSPLRPSARRGCLVGLGRVELPTSPLSGVRSSHLSYRPAPAQLVELIGIEPTAS